MSWLEQVLSNKQRVYYLRCRIGEYQPWYVLQVKLSAEQRFKDVLQSKRQFNLSDFGEILYAGLNQPDAAIREEVLRLYGLAIAVD